jgi:hypothetical protein
MVDGVPSSGREERRQLARLCGGLLVRGEVRIQYFFGE